MTDQPTIGFLGLGLMGSRMAARLLEHGYPLVVYNRTVEKSAALKEGGAVIASSPADLAARSDVIICSLANDTAVDDVMLGSGGVVASLKPGTTVIDCSTVSPETSRRIAEAVQGAGGAMLDVPVSGTTPQAESGNLVLLVGGDAEVLARCRPILEVLGQQIFHLGGNGMGSTMKLVVNALLGVAIQGLGEALALGQKAGLEKGLLIDVLGQMPILTGSQKAKMENARRDQYPVAFPIDLMEKDFGLVTDLAGRLAVPMPATAAARQMTAAERSKHREEDFSAVIALMEELAGLRR